MAEGIQGTGDVTPKTEDKGFTPIETQEEFDKVTATIKYKERQKYTNYEEYKKAAGELEQIKEANKTELEKAIQRAEAAEKALAAANDAKQRAEDHPRLRGEYSPRSKT